METYLSEYIVTEHELMNVSDDVRKKFEELLSGKDRLRCYMELFEIARTAVETLESANKKGFIDQINEELNKVRSDLDVQLAKRASEVQEKFNKLQESVELATNELRIHGNCIEEVLNGMGKIEDYEENIKLIDAKLKDLDKIIKTISDARQKEAFVEMCKLATRES